MPTITMTNSIGQPTGETIAVTQKPVIIPVRATQEGGITPPAPTLAEAVVKTPTPPTKQKDPAKMQEEERFQALARREKQMRQRVREYEAREAETRTKYEQERAAAQAQIEEAKQAKQWQESLKTDLIGTLSQAGYTPDQITQALINQPGPESQLIKSLSEKIAKMEKAQQDHFKSQQDEAQKNYNSALATIERNVNKVVNGNPEFEATEAYGAQKKVVNYIEKVWKDEGVMLDVEDAVKDVEDFLTEEATKVAKIKKIQKQLAPKPALATQPTPVVSKSPTLTNKMATHGKPLSAKERAILAFNNGRVRR